MVQNISRLSVSQISVFVNKLCIRLELRQKIFNANKALENQIKALKSVTATGLTAGGSSYTQAEITKIITTLNEVVALGTSTTCT